MLTVDTSSANYLGFQNDRVLCRIRWPVISGTRAAGILHIFAIDPMTTVGGSAAVDMGNISLNNIRIQTGSGTYNTRDLTTPGTRTGAYSLQNFNLIEFEDLSPVLLRFTLEWKLNADATFSGDPFFAGAFLRQFWMVTARQIYVRTRLTRTSFNAIRNIGHDFYLGTGGSVWTFDRRVKDSSTAGAWTSLVAGPTIVTLSDARYFHMRRTATTPPDKTVAYADRHLLVAQYRKNRTVTQSALVMQQLRFERLAADALGVVAHGARYQNNNTGTWVNGPSDTNQDILWDLMLLPQTVNEDTNGSGEGGHLGDYDSEGFVEASGTDEGNEAAEDFTNPETGETIDDVTHLYSKAAASDEATFTLTNPRIASQGTIPHRCPIFKITNYTSDRPPVLEISKARSPGNYAAGTRWLQDYHEKGERHPKPTTLHYVGMHYASIKKAGENTAYVQWLGQGRWETSIQFRIAARAVQAIPRAMWLPGTQTNRLERVSIEEDATWGTITKSIDLTSTGSTKPKAVAVGSGRKGTYVWVGMANAGTTGNNLAKIDPNQSSGTLVASYRILDGLECRGVAVDHDGNVAGVLQNCVTAPKDRIFVFEPDTGALRTDFGERDPATGKQRGWARTGAKPLSIMVCPNGDYIVPCRGGGTLLSNPLRPWSGPASFLVRHTHDGRIAGAYPLPIGARGGAVDREGNVYVAIFGQVGSINGTAVEGDDLRVMKFAPDFTLLGERNFATRGPIYLGVSNDIDTQSVAGFLPNTAVYVLTSGTASGGGGPQYSDYFLYKVSGLLWHPGNDWPGQTNLPPQGVNVEPNGIKPGFFAQDGKGRGIVGFREAVGNPSGDTPLCLVAWNATGPTWSVRRSAATTGKSLQPDVVGDATGYGFCSTLWPESDEDADDPGDATKANRSEAINAKKDDQNDTSGKPAGGWPDVLKAN